MPKLGYETKVHSNESVPFQGGPIERPGIDSRPVNSFAVCLEPHFGNGPQSSWHILLTSSLEMSLFLFFLGGGAYLEACEIFVL